MSESFYSSYLPKDSPNYQAVSEIIAHVWIAIYLLGCWYVSFSRTFVLILSAVALIWGSKVSFPEEGLLESFLAQRKAAGLAVITFFVVSLSRIDPFFYLWTALNSAALWFVFRTSPSFKQFFAQVLVKGDKVKFPTVAGWPIFVSILRYLSSYFCFINGFYFTSVFTLLSSPFIPDDAILEKLNLRAVNPLSGELRNRFYKILNSMLRSEADSRNIILGFSAFICIMETSRTYSLIPVRILLLYGVFNFHDYIVSNVLFPKLPNSEVTFCSDPVPDLFSPQPIASPQNSQPSNRDDLEYIYQEFCEPIYDQFLGPKKEELEEDGHIGGPFLLLLLSYFYSILVLKTKQMHIVTPAALHLQFVENPQSLFNLSKSGVLRIVSIYCYGMSQIELTVENLTNQTVMLEILPGTIFEQEKRWNNEQNLAVQIAVKTLIKRKTTLVITLKTFCLNASLAVPTSGGSMKATPFALKGAEGVFGPLGQHSDQSRFWNYAGDVYRGQKIGEK